MVPPALHPAFAGRLTVDTPLGAGGNRRGKHRGCGAADVIHTDFQKSFIRAGRISFEDSIKGIRYLRGNPL